MTSAFHRRIMESPLLGTTDFGELFTNVTNASRDDLIKELNKALQQTGFDGDYKLSDAVLRYIALELVTVAVLPQRGEKRGRVDEPTNPAARLIHDFMETGKMRDANERYLNEPWVNTLRQAEGMQRHFDDMLLSIVGVPGENELPRVSEIEKKYRKDGVEFYNHVARGISDSTVPSEMAPPVIQAREIVRLVFYDYNETHGYVSMMHILTYYQLNEVFRLAVIDLCKTICSVGFQDGDEKILAGFPSSDVNELGNSLARANTVHLMTNSPPRLLKKVIENVETLYMYDNNILPVDDIQPGKLKYIHWVMNMTLVGDFPAIQLEYFEKLGTAYPRNFGNKKGMRSVNVQFLYFDYKGDPVDIPNFKSAKAIKNRTLTFLVNTTRGYVKSLKPAFQSRHKNKNLVDIVAGVSDSFYVSANFSDLVTDGYTFYEPGYFYFTDAGESSSELDSSDEEDGVDSDDDDDDGNAMDIGRSISMRSARAQLTILLSHMGLPAVDRIKSLSRSGLIFFIRNLLAAPENSDEFPYVTLEALRVLARDLNNQDSWLSPFAAISEMELDEANISRDDDERLAYYTNMTLSDITRIYNRYSSITETGHTAPGGRVDVINTADFMDIDRELISADTDPFSMGNFEFDMNPYRTGIDDPDFSFSIPAISRNEASVRAEQEAVESTDKSYSDKIRNVTLDIKATVYEIIKRNAAYTHQGYPDLLKLIRICRMSPLFFEVAVESYLPTVTSMVVRGKPEQLAALENEMKRIPDNEWDSFRGAFVGLIRIMSAYSDPILKSSSMNARLKPFLMNILEYRVLSYGSMKAPKIPLIAVLFSAPNETAKLRVLVIQFRVTVSLRRLWTQRTRELDIWHDYTIDDNMKTLMRQLSLVIEQPAPDRMTRVNMARYFGDPPKKGGSVSKLREVLRDLSTYLGGVLQFRPGTGLPEIIWPSEWPGSVADVEAEKRTRSRRTMTDLAVLHEILNRPPEIPTSPLDSKIVKAQQDIESAIRERDRFQQVVTIENYMRYRYPRVRTGVDDVRVMPIEFKSKEDFEEFNHVYLSTHSLYKDDLFVMSASNGMYYEELMESAASIGTTVNEIIYACLTHYIFGQTDITIAQIGGAFPIESLLDMAIDSGPMGWAVRNMLAVRLPVLSVGRDIGSNPLMDVRNNMISTIVSEYLVNVTDIRVESSIDHPLLRQISKRVNAVSIPADALPIADFELIFSPGTLRYLRIRMDSLMGSREYAKIINDITHLFTPQPVPDLNRDSAFSLMTYADTLFCMRFGLKPEKINRSDLEPHIAELPFLVQIRDTVISSEDMAVVFKNFEQGQGVFIQNVYAGKLGTPDTPEAQRPFVSTSGSTAAATITIPATQMQAPSSASLRTSQPTRSFAFSLDLTKIHVDLVGSDREYAPIIYAWTSWGSGRRPIRIAATDDDAIGVTSNWSLTLPVLYAYRVECDYRVHFSLYARSRESGLESINREEASVIDRIIPIGRTSISLRQLLRDSVMGANRNSRLLHFEEPVLNERLENQMIQQMGIKVTETQRNSVRDKVMRENSSGRFRVSLVLSMYQLSVVAPELLDTMEKDVTRRFQRYTDEKNTRVAVPPFEESLLESLYVRAMYPLYLRYAAWFIGDEKTPPIVVPSTKEAASLHLFLWQTPIGALLPARAFWQCTPALIPYTNKSDQEKDTAMFEDSYSDYKEMYFLNLLQISLDIDDISTDMFMDVVNRQLADTDGTRVHEWFMTCAAACVRIGMLAANALHYTSDFRFDRTGKQYEDEYWNIDVSSGLSNAADCENSAQLATTPLLRSIVTNKGKWCNPLMQTVVRVLELYSIADIGAVVTAAYVGPSDPSRTGELPVIGSTGDKKSDTGGHCHGVLTPYGTTSDQALNGRASRKQVSEAYGSTKWPPWHYRLHKMVVEGTGSIFPYVLPLQETFAEQPNEYAFHKSKKALADSLVKRLGFPQGFGFSTYRYPFYDNKPSANRRVSSFYRLLCHGIYSIEATKAPELGKLTFAKPIGKNRYAWGVNIGEYLRDGRSGPGSARLALISSCLDMRSHFTRYVNPYIESVVRQLPLASVGRLPISTWAELENPKKTAMSSKKSIRSSLACVLCPRCEPGASEKSVIAAYGIRELVHTGNTRGRISVDTLISERKVTSMRRLANVAIDENNYTVFSDFFSPTTLRRYALASPELARTFIRGNVWENHAKFILGSQLYRDTVIIRSDFADVLSGVPMYFIIIAADMVRRRQSLPRGRFSPSICVVTETFQKQSVDIPEGPNTNRNIAMLSAMLANGSIEVCMQLLPILGSSVRYHASLQSVRSEINDNNARVFEADILEKWKVHLPSGDETAPPTALEFSNMSLDELATLWIDVCASEQWHRKIQILLTRYLATPRAIMEMSYDEVEAYVIPEEQDVGPMLMSPEDNPAFLLSPTPARREVIARAMLLDDAYDASMRLQTSVTAETKADVSSVQTAYFTFSTLGYGNIDEETVSVMISPSNITHSYYGCLALIFEDRIVSGGQPDGFFSYEFSMSNWGFYRVDVIVGTEGPRDEFIFENSKPSNNQEVQMETTAIAGKNLLLPVRLLEIDDMLGPINTQSYFLYSKKPTVDKFVVHTIGQSVSTYPTRALPDPRKLSFFAFGWLVKSPEDMVPFRNRIDEESGTDCVVDVFTPLPSTGDASLRIVVDLSASRK